MPNMGEYWYAMIQPDDTPQGYAHLVIRPLEDGGFNVQWELKIAFTGGSYEEERYSSFDANHVMTSVGYVSGDQKFVAERDGDHLVVSDPENTDPIAVTDDAIAGMGFVLAATMPLEVGAQLKRRDHNEAQGMLDEGVVTFEVTGKETLDLAGKKIETHKIVMTRQSGNELPIWVDADRRIVRADWGPGTRMEMRDEPTTGLFKPEAPAFVEVGEDATKLVVIGDFPGMNAAAMYRHWTDAEKLILWWPQEADVEARKGGKYHLVWKQPEWRMRGEIRDLEESKRLVFSWKWDHLPDLPELEVTVELEEIEGGCRVRITHGPYEESERDRKERAGHLEGWKFFGAKLRALGRN